MIVGKVFTELSPESKVQLDRLTSRWNETNEAVFVATMIDVIEKVGVKPAAFQAHLEREKEDMESGNSYEFLDDLCEGRQWVDDRYMCIWGQENAPPKTKIISKEKFGDGAANFCKGCTKTKDMVAGVVTRDTRIAELEYELEAKATKVFKAPVCKGGASLSLDGKRFEGCRKTPPNTPAGVEKYCKVYDHGNPCALYGEAVIGVGADT